MPEYSKAAMNKALKDLEVCVDEMKFAIENMAFESGEVGVTDRCNTHLGYFLDELDNARRLQGDVARLILAAQAKSA